MDISIIDTQDVDINNITNTSTSGNDNYNNNNNSSDSKSDTIWSGELGKLWKYSDDFEFGNVIALLWKLPAVQNTFKKRHCKFSFPDLIPYYFNTAQIIMKSNYFATHDDVLKARIRTTGIINFKYDFKLTDHDFDLDSHDHDDKHKNKNKKMGVCFVDVGCERKKWIQCFDQVCTIMFIAGLDDYVSMLFEQQSVNSMHETLALFECVLIGKWFKVKYIHLSYN